MKKVTAIVLCVFTLSSCQEGQNEGMGTFLGMLGGAVIGSAIAGDGGGHHGRYGRRGGGGNGGAIIVGAIAGAVIGNSIGKRLDEADRAKMYQAQHVAFENYPSGQQSNWYNPDTGNSGSYTPRPAQQERNGQYCREYQQTVTIGGNLEEAYGKACRQPDGNWKIVNDAI
ncbi:MAG: RT0821/Lpp0805 family surface protein [Emcibacteraceae bacterium]|nr:RT0821/Lpp0805 family surface protein [Emcibacteraceae bacterium]MDG1997113.1 RT0821/Lpp0805 family surface protein [Emcibacteraceae bacterium]